MFEGTSQQTGDRRRTSAKDWSWSWTACTARFTFRIQLHFEFKRTRRSRPCLMPAPRGPSTRRTTPKSASHSTWWCAISRSGVDLALICRQSVGRSAADLGRPNGSWARGPRSGAGTGRRPRLAPLGPGPRAPVEAPAAAQPLTLMAPRPPPTRTARRAKRPSTPLTRSPRGRGCPSERTGTGGGARGLGAGLHRPARLRCTHSLGTCRPFGSLRQNWVRVRSMSQSLNRPATCASHRYVAIEVHYDTHCADTHPTRFRLTFPKQHPYI